MSESAASLPSQENPSSALAQTARTDCQSSSGIERRHRRRAPISALLRVRGLNVTDADNPDEVSTTIDVSRIGLLFLTRQGSYVPGMDLAVTFPYSKTPTAIHAEQSGRVVRVVEMSGGVRAVAISLVKSAHAAGVQHQLVDAAGREICKEMVAPVVVAAAASSDQLTKKPLIVAVDADDLLRENLKTYFVAEGYEVIAVNNAPDAREVMNMLTPALVIAEVEGEGLPGFDLCAHVKSTPKLRHVPVILTTKSAYPSDYANAHSLGAVVCMAKPYKQDRMGHVVRLLAPTPEAKAQPAPKSPSAPASKPPVDDAPPRRWRFRL